MVARLHTFLKGHAIGLAMCLAFAGLLGLGAPPAWAQTSNPAGARAAPILSLKANPGTQNVQITFGDVFDNAGALASQPLARAPGPGQTVVFGAGPLQARVRAAGYNWPNRENVRQVVVNGTQQGETEEAEVPEPSVSRPEGGRTRTTAQASARPEAIAVLARTIPRGEEITDADVVWMDTPAAAPRDALADPEALIGKTARRTLLANTPLRAMDVMETPAVRRNEPVTLLYEARGLKLTVRGKAMADAPIGATVKVLNPQSNKVLEAVVEGPGTARVMLSQLSARVTTENGVN
jgi:flagella basal body P-ring formation protein FlgA